MTSEWTSANPCNRTTLSERCKECIFFYKPALCPANRENTKGDPKMNPETLTQLYELRGMLRAQFDVAACDMKSCADMIAEDPGYSATRYFEGRLDALDKERARHARAIQKVNQIIKEIEHAEE